MRCLCFLCLAGILVFAAASAAGGQREFTHWIHGEIVEVFPEQNKLRVLYDGKMGIFSLTRGGEIYRGGRLVSLVSTRPITESRFQEGLFFFNEHGEIILMIVDYSIAEVETEAGSVLVYYDIFGRVKDMEQIPPFERDPVICSE